jgi:hypothetical protein
MARLSTSLIFLLLILTFNAYACVLPLQTSSNMDCPSTPDEPLRQTCDAFLEIGPHSKQVSDQSSSITPLELAIASYPLNPEPTNYLSHRPPAIQNTGIHISIATTVLRI